MADTIRARSVEKAQDSGGHVYKERPEFKDQNSKFPSLTLATLALNPCSLPCWDLGARNPSSGALNRKLRVQWLGVNGKWCPVKAETSELHGMRRDSPIHTINKSILI